MAREMVRLLKNAYKILVFSGLAIVFGSLAGLFLGVMANVFNWMVS